LPPSLPLRPGQGPVRPDPAMDVDAVAASWGMHLAAQADELRARGSRVETIVPDSDSRDAFGVNLMDPSTRPPSAQAGYGQGRALARQLAELWR
jgi:hypothetical protein